MIIRNPALLLLAALPLMAQPASDVAAKADAYVESYVKAGKFSGSVLIAKDGKVILSRGYGMADIELDVPNKPETKFRLGSITKQFTSAAILQLQEQGKLSVTDEISKYIPDPPETWKGITIHHLLTHTSGIPSYTDNHDYIEHMRDVTASPLEFLSRFRGKPLEFKPGSQFKYDNSGFFLLGVIIERVSGMKYEDYLRQHIFDKVGMSDTGYDWPTTILKNRASGYSMDKGKIINAEYLDMGQPYAAGSLYSTVLDLYKWDRALYTTNVMSAKSKEAAFTPHLSNYGYGWFIEQQHGHKTVGHGGGINGFSTVIRRAIEEDAVAIVLSNNDYTGTPGKMGKELLGLVLGEDVHPYVERQEITADPKTFERLTGKYQVGPMAVEVRVDNGKLILQPTGQRALELHPYAPNAFFLKEVDVTVVFPGNGPGRAEEIIVNQGGEQKGKRIE
ncbi:MAG TPA: serine hydrolase domain-containing protein [Bryobacteraceae bacterium]|jgi:CubicO group peptidase (beta-lactamase class C family)